MENSFLLSKIVTLRTEIDNFKITVDEYEQFSASLMALNDEISKENSHLKAHITSKQGPAERHRKPDNEGELKAALYELQEKDRVIERLQAERESNQRLFDLLFLICLSINVCVLLFFGWEHFVDFIPSLPSTTALTRAMSAPRGHILSIESAAVSLSVFRVKLIDSLNTLRYSVSNAYEKVSRTIAHLIVIVR